MFRLLSGDCREALRLLGPDSVDAVVCDPPYELGFMGKGWDSTGIAYDVGLWKEALRVLKPGGHLIAFGATRTYHRMAVAIEDAGFQMRDSLHWIYGSGFPKSTDLSKEADKQAGIWRGRAGALTSGNPAMSGGNYARTAKGEPVTEAGWNLKGWGSALKPGHEPFVLARKPMPSTLIKNVLGYGLGGLNIDACRVPYKPGSVDFSRKQRQQRADGVVQFGAAGLIGKEIDTYKEGGRWPANIVFSHSATCAEACADDCPVAALEAQYPGASEFFSVIGGDTLDTPFFYSPKVSRVEREAGCEHLPLVSGAEAVNRTEGSAGMGPRAGAGRTAELVHNHHPTVKPWSLMAWCINLVCPANGVVVDPFMGSGSTGIAAVRTGRNFIGIEQNAAYYDIARARIGHALRDFPAWEVCSDQEGTAGDVA
jgi:site-specific DNA-methyltransferase (adenine-specific)